jgi:hypothetical protein
MDEFGEQANSHTPISIFMGSSTVTDGNISAVDVAIQ